MLNPNSTQLRGPPLCYRTQHALPCSDLSGLFSPLIAFFFPPTVFLCKFFFFCEQQKSGPEANMWNGLFFHFISFIQRYSIFSFYLKMNHENPPTRSAVSACFFGCSVSDLSKGFCKILLTDRLQETPDWVLVMIQIWGLNPYGMLKGSKYQFHFKMSCEQRWCVFGCIESFACALQHWRWFITLVYLNDRHTERTVSCLGGDVARLLGLFDSYLDRFSTALIFYDPQRIISSLCWPPDFLSTHM